MSKESLFSYLVSYVPTDKREAKEDYLTQIFAWILANVENAANIYGKYLCEKGNIPYAIQADAAIAVSTQTAVPSGRIDLLLNVNRDIAFLCEHKVHSQLSANQIQKYMDDSSLLGNEKYYSVLLASNALQHTQKADVCIVWSDVYGLFAEHLKEYDGKNEFVLKQFLKYLAENGLGKAAMIPREALLAYWPAIRLESQLAGIFRQLANLDFAMLCPGIETLGTGFAPAYHKTRWGRIGIDMFPSWNPGLFAGVILAPYDHQLEPLDRDKGPDFAIFLESEYSQSDEDKRRIYEKNIHSAKYCSLCRLLSAQSGPFQFEPGIAKSKWRIAVLRMPLYDILAGPCTQAEQAEAIKEKMTDGIRRIIAAWNAH